MLMRIDGRSLTTDQVEFLLDAVDFRSLHTGLLAKGYRLCKARAPRRFPANGVLTMRFAWTLRDAAGHQVTVRMVGTVDVSPA
jgi:hypothetical protein